MEMRKIIGILLCLVLCLTPIETKAKVATAGVDENGNTWVYDKSTKTLTFSGNENISDFEMDGHSDEPKWYKWSDKAEHIVIEDGIKGIGSEAFCGFVNVKSITMSDTVVQIGDRAFEDCESLREITLPNGLKKVGAFSFCEKLTNIVFPNTITQMEKGILSGNKNLKSVKLPNSIKVINRYDFSNCKKLKKIDIPISVRTVNMSAFAGTGLKKIVLPKNVVEIKNGDYGRKVFKHVKGMGYPTKNAS